MGALAQIGLDVTVLERAPQLREEGAAISLWTNAFRALDALQAASPLRSAYLPLTRSVCSTVPASSTQLQPGLLATDVRTQGDCFVLHAE